MLLLFYARVVNASPFTRCGANFPETQNFYYRGLNRVRHFILTEDADVVCLASFRIKTEQQYVQQQHTDDFMEKYSLRT